MSPQVPSPVDRVAEAEFKGLMAFVSTLKSRDRRRGGTRNPQAENRALDTLIDTFEEEAQFYYDTGKGLIEELAQATGQDPWLLTLAYYELLSNLAEHVQLLTDMARPHLDASFGEGHDFCKPSLTENRAAIEKVIAIIAARTRPPTFFRIPSQNFKYVHFNYVQNLGVVGVPEYVMAAPAWNLSLLWHEKAGYDVAEAERATHLAQWRGELAAVLDSYQDNYVRSFVDSVLAEVEEADEGPCSYRIVNCEGLETFLETDKDWQLDWLGEFLEDLFGVQALGGAMVEGLADALAQRYPDFALGDAEHPPPYERLKVALAYLDLVSPGVADPEARELLFDPQKTRERLTLRYSDIPAPDDNARAIAQFYQSLVEGGKFSKQNAKISAEERALAKIIGQARYQFFEKGKSLEEVSRTLCEGLDGLEPPGSEPLSKDVEGFQKMVQDAIDNAIGIEDAPESEGDAVLMKFEALLRVHFADVDWVWPPMRNRRRRFFWRRPTTVRRWRP